MTIWKNTCGESWQDTIENGWEVSGKTGAFLFFIPKGTYSPPAKAGGGSPPVGRARALISGPRAACGGCPPKRTCGCSPRGIAAPAGAAGQGCISAKLPAFSMQSAQGFPFWKPLFMGWYIATPSRRLPASPCHRQLDTDTGVERIVPPLLVVRRISRRTERKQGCPVSGHPFQKGQGDLWRFIIWRPRWSAVEPDAPPWLLRPI